MASVRGSTALLNISFDVKTHTFCEVTNEKKEIATNAEIYSF
jgi:hypothetical protein